MSLKDETNQNKRGKSRLFLLRARGGDDHGDVGLQTIEDALCQPHVGLTHVAALRLGVTTP